MNYLQLGTVWKIAYLFNYKVQVLLTTFLLVTNTFIFDLAAFLLVDVLLYLAQLGRHVVVVDIYMYMHCSVGWLQRKLSAGECE